MELSTPRKPTLRTREQDTLDGDQVLEITLFAEKREWIQDKIHFLSTTLPRIIVHEPLPPLRSTTTNEELEEWWKEHEAIEHEVNDFDYGDLNKMRNFAKQKSKQELSTRDTDLIEVCLTTLFALDKLLSLLRQRRKSLVLLGYRLQWEQALRVVWDAHRRLLDQEIPTFLSKSQFLIPSTPCESFVENGDQGDGKEDEGGGEGEGSLVNSHSTSSNLSTTSSTSHSSRSRRISSLTLPSPTRTSFTSPTASPNNNSTHHQTLLVLLSAQLKSHLAKLSLQSLPTSSNLLDNLIDLSPVPLPEAFLDEQDKVEDTVKIDLHDSDHSRGGGGGLLIEWLEDRVEQWTRDKQVWEVCRESSQKSIELRKEVEQLEEEEKRLRIDLRFVDDDGRSNTDEDEVGRRRRRRNDREWVEEFEERLGKIRAGLDRVNELRGGGGGRRKHPSLVHRMYPRAIEESNRNEEELGGQVRRATELFEQTKKKVERYGRGVKAVERARIVRERLGRELAKLDEARGEIDRLEEPEWNPDLRTEDELDDYAKRFDALSEPVDIEEIVKLVKDGFGVIVDLEQIGIDQESRREFKELVQAVDGSRKRFDDLVAEELIRRQRWRVAINVLVRIREGRESLAELQEKAVKEVERVRWTAEKTFVGGSSDFSDLGDTVRIISQRSTRAFDSSRDTLYPLPSVLTKLENLLTAQNRDVDTLLSLKDGIERTWRQTEAINVFEQELESIRYDLEAISIETSSPRREIVSSFSPSPSAEAPLQHSEKLDQRLEATSATLDSLVSDVHLRIPFLSLATSSSTVLSVDSRLPFDTKAHDEAVRLHLNTSITRAKRERDEARRNVDTLKTMSIVQRWGEKWREFESKIEEIGNELDKCDESIRENEHDGPDTLSEVETALTTSETNLDSLEADLESLSTSLAEPSGSSSVPAHLQPDRQKQYEGSYHRHFEMSSRTRSARGQIAAIRKKREERFEGLRQEQLRLLDIIDARGAALKVLEAEVAKASTRLDEADNRLDAAQANPRNLSCPPDDSRSFDYEMSTTVSSIVQRLQTIEYDLAAASDDLSTLESSVIPSNETIDIVATRTTFEQVRTAHLRVMATLRNVQTSFEAYRNRQSKLETEREQLLVAKRQTHIEVERLDRTEEEECRGITTSNLVDVFGEVPALDPFADSPLDDESPEISTLRTRVESLRLRDWLDSEANLRLPSSEESDELRKSLRNIQDDFNGLATRTDSSGTTTTDDFSSLVSSKEPQMKRIADLAAFSTKVATVDAALSDLLDSIDAATPGSSSLSSNAQSEAPLPLSKAIVQASDAVTAVRLEAIPLVDDRRVEQAIGRIEESWAEMMIMVEDVRPRPRSAASSTSSSTTSSRTTSSSRLSSRIPPRPPSVSGRSLSRSSSSSSTASIPFPSSRPSSRSTATPSSRAPSLRRSTSRSSTFLSTPSRTITDDDDPLATPRRRNGPSGLPLPTPRRNASALPPITPTTARPFSFTSNSKAKAASSIPRRTPLSTPRKGADSRSSSTSERGVHSSSSSMVRLASTSSKASSSRRDSLASSVSSRRSSVASSTYRRPSLSPENLSRIGYRSSPPKNQNNRRKYRANLSNKLDREVGTIVNALDIHVPIAMADGSWSDESGMYKIGDKVYFCRILRSKNVMVRVGGGWLNLLQFIITHFAPAETINISPTTPVKRTFAGTEPQWISSAAVRDQLIPTQSASSLRTFLDSSVSSNGSQQSDQSLSASISMRRSISSSSNYSTPLRRSLGAVGGSHSNLFSPQMNAGGTPRQQSRPPIPVWRP